MRFWQSSPLVSLFFLLIGLITMTILISARAATAVQAQPSIWQDGLPTATLLRGERQAFPDQYRALTADLTALEAVLAQAPHEQTVLARGSDVVLALPLPNGEYGRFQLVEAPIMAPELAAKYPEIKSYRGRGLDHPTATARLSYTPLGLHAIITGLPDGTVFIDPFTAQVADQYISYQRENYRRELPDFTETVVGEPPELPALFGGGLSTGTDLRIFRLALATTGEYAQFHMAEQGIGDAKTAAINAINVAMTRVNAIYEQELAVRMVLVANNDNIIYADEQSDPYTNSSGIAMLGENQANLDAVIGSANYDIGHVFSTGGGGVARLASLCEPAEKAQGVTGQSSPINDPFYVDYVAHEIGHQFGAQHVFNGTALFCSGSNRTAAAAFEPGSGTTIMGYAGICGSQNIQSNSDAYFNVGNFDEMASVVAAASCGTTQPLTNVPPVVDAGADYVIPVSTAFELTGSATDADDDALTFAWEQHDLGAAGAPTNPIGNAPLFRSFFPVSSASRLFPQQSDLVNNTQTLGEILPSYERNMTFRLTARDGNGGVAYDEMRVEVVDNEGAFAVTYPNTAVSHLVNTPVTVTWDVAGTDQPPIDCADVDISLSIDNGATFELLLAATPNDGEATITPTVATDEARLKVACSDNIFLDWSDLPFELVGVMVTHEALETAVMAGDIVNLTSTFTNGFTRTAPISATRSFDLPLLNPNCTAGFNIDEMLEASETADFPCTATADPALTLLIAGEKTAADRFTNEISYTVSLENPTGYTIADVVLDDSNDPDCLPTTATFAPGEIKQFACSVTSSEPLTLTFSAMGSLEVVNSLTAVVDNGTPQIATETIVINFATTKTLNLDPAEAFQYYLPLIQSD